MRLTSRGGSLQKKKRAGANPGLMQELLLERYIYVKLEHANLDGIVSAIDVCYRSLSGR
jgi:hypothetical protein